MTLLPWRRIISHLLVLIVFALPINAHSSAGIVELVGITIFPFIPISKFVPVQTEGETSWYYIPTSDMTWFRRGAASV
jgi:hypothetical protein